MDAASPNLAKLKTPQHHALDDDGLQAVHQASLELLQSVGYHMPVPEARQLVEKNGGRVEGERAYLTQSMIARALDSLRPFTLYNRQGRPSRVLQPGQVCFSTIADTFYVHDPYSQTVRPFVKDDQRWLATVIDALENIDYVQVVGQAHDVPDGLQTQTAAAETMRCTSKPLLVYPYDRRGLLDVLDLAQAVRGSAEALAAQPFVMCAAVPAAPLSGTVYQQELLLTCAERRVPLLAYNCPALGGNSPADIAATLVLANADWLANLTLHQLKRPGAPFCTAGFTMQLMDMKTTLWSYCAPETLQGYAAAADLAHWYGLPAFGLEMTCDVPDIDAQMGVELEAQCLRAFMCSVEAVHNAGIYGAGKLCGAEAIILADEIIAAARASFQPVSVTSAGLAEASDLIAEAGPSGEYVTRAHTLQNFRKFWYPRAFERPMFDPRAETPRTGLVERLNRQARRLIEQHHPEPLPAEALDRLAAVEAGWQNRRPD